LYAAVRHGKVSRNPVRMPFASVGPPTQSKQPPPVLRESRKEKKVITKAKVTKGFATKLPSFDKEFKFQKGLNILFGPNACGKTTLLNILGAYCSTKSGWSRYIEPSFNDRGDKFVEYPKRCATIAPGRDENKCEAKVEWDGTATFFTSAETSDAVSHVLEGTPDGLLDLGQIVGEIVNKPSLGQKRIYRLNMLLTHSKEVPDLTAIPPEYNGYNDLWQKAMNKFIEYVKTLPRTGPSTILLDEPDRSLSIPMQVALWRDIMPKLAEKFQVIVATHCPAALSFKDALIDFQKGYANECLTAMKQLQ